MSDLADLGAHYSVNALSDRQRTWVWSALAIANLVWLGNGLYVQHLAASSPALYWAADLLQWVVLPTAMAMALWRFAGVGFRDYGFVSVDKHWMKTLGDSVGVFMTAGVLFFLARHVASILLGVTGGFDLANVVPQGALLYAVFMIYWSATAGLVESALYIGLPWLLYRGVTSGSSRMLLVLVTSAVFAIGHWEKGSPVVIGAFVSNIVLWLWFFHHKSLWPVAGGHFLTDLVAVA